MPPKAQSNVLRGRGRPKLSVVPGPPIPVAVADAPKKRGRPAKAEVAEAVAGPPKKRGRPSKASGEEEAIVAAEPRKRGRPSLTASGESSVLKKRMGRPIKKSVANEAVSEPKARLGRPRKVEAGAEDARATPKRRGRPPGNATAIDLSRVAGSPRITKSRSQPAAPRLNPRLRSKLRTRLPPAQKVKAEPVPQPTKRRGRPPKATVAQASSPKKAPSHKSKGAAITKIAAPRKKRGITVVEVPDKFAAQIQRYLQELQDAETLPSPDADAFEDEDAEVGAEEQELHITKEDAIIADADENGALDVTEEIQGEGFYDEDDDADAAAIIDSSVQEDDVQDEIVEDIVIHEDIDDEPTEAATEVEIAVNVHEVVHEVVQVQQDAGNVDTSEQELDAFDQAHQDTHQSIFEPEDSEDGYALHGGSRPTAGVIFG